MKYALFGFTLSFFSSAVFSAPLCSGVLLEQTLVQQKILMVKAKVSEKVLGQDDLVEKTLLALVSGGHVLLSGSPGLAKTRLVNTIANNFDADFKKEQFTVDTSPTELKGESIYVPSTGETRVQPGLLFTNFFLADEINRATQKTQNATLSAMAEGEVVIRGVPHALPDVYLFVGTQNPDEEEGIFPLPKAQQDRFLFQINVNFPDKETERQISKLVMDERARQYSTDSGDNANLEQEKLSLNVVREARKEVLLKPLPREVENYILDLVDATRNPGLYSDRNPLNRYIQSGSSPRATISLMIASRAVAWMRGHMVVQMQDVDFIAKDVLRHRIQLSREAEEEQLNSDKILDMLIEQVKIKLHL